MKFQALLVLNDDSAAEVLSQVLAEFQVGSERCPDASVAVQKLEEKTFDAVIVDFDDSPAAAQALQNAHQSQAGKNVVTVGLLSDPANVRSAFGLGANFVLYKPISSERAHASLRAAVALLKRERRRTFRVPVQLPIVLSWEGTPEVEGIMLDLSEDGMDVLSAHPLQGSQNIEFQFSLPNSSELKAKGLVVWANTNGQAGIQFVGLSDEQRETLCTWLGANAPEAPPEEPEPLSECKLSDLSPGGCYVETESPFPRQANVDLCLRAPDFEVHIDGVVRVMHPSRGMGIEFASDEAAQQVGKFIEVLTSQPGATPQLSVAPKSINWQGNAAAPPAEDAGEDALLHLLHTGDTMAEDEFLAELRRQRSSEAEATSA